MSVGSINKSPLPATRNASVWDIPSSEVTREFLTGGVGCFSIQENNAHISQYSSKPRLLSPQTYLLGACLEQSALRPGFLRETLGPLRCPLSHEAWWDKTLPSLGRTAGHHKLQERMETYTHTNLSHLQKRRPGHVRTYTPITDPKGREGRPQVLSPEDCASTEDKHTQSTPGA